MYYPTDARYSVAQAYKVSPKEEAFCVAIVSGSNASDAYRTAYRPQRAKAKTIHEKASRLMAKGKVRARIAELMAPVIADAQMTRAEWVERLTRCCRFDPRKLFDSTGKLKGIRDLEDNEAMAILALQCSDDDLEHGPPGGKIRRTAKLKFIDRVAALSLLGQACHFYADRPDEPGTDGSQRCPNVTVSFIPTPISPEEVYRRLL